MKVLIIEDDKILASSLRKIFINAEYDADIANDGSLGLDYAISGQYDLIVLDVMLPEMNGFSVAQALRRKHNSTPILMLTAKTDVTDRIEGLNCGADYYLTKPFDTNELLACANVLLRRVGKEINELTYGNISLDMSSCALICGDNSIRLSSKEFGLSKMLFANKDNIISKEQILLKVWGFDSDAGDNNVEVYIGFLRKKFKSLDANIQIKSVRGLGYHLEVL